jgi:hypothetical protein
MTDSFKAFIGKIPKAHVGIDVDKYTEETEGGKTRGRKLWKFKIGEGNIVQLNGTYSEAKKEAISLASRNGYKNVQVLK